MHNCYTAILFVHFLHTILLKLRVFWGLIHRSNLQTLTNCANFQFTSDVSCRLWINSRVPHSAPFDHLKVPKLTREKAISVARHWSQNHFPIIFALKGCCAAYCIIIKHSYEASSVTLLVTAEQPVGLWSGPKADTGEMNGGLNKIEPL